MSGETILVVDDEPQIRRVMRSTLSTHGYLITEAKTGEEGVEAVRKERPDLVLLDINMPGMDGLTLLGEIKKRFPDLSVMMVTAYGDDERRRRANTLGATEFITKPVDFDRLKEQLRQLPTAAD